MRIGANTSPTRPETGYVGFFEATDGGDPVVARTLLDAALEWLRERGVRQAYGPIDRSTSYGYRFCVESPAGEPLKASEEPFSWEPWQPSGYVEAFLAAGFDQAERYHSLGYRGVEGMRLLDAARIVQGAADAARARGYGFEPFSERWDEVLPDLYEVGKVCFERNVLAEPLEWEEFVALYENTGATVDYRPSVWLVDPQGRKRGMSFSYVDRGYLVGKTGGVAPELRRGGLALALYWATLINASKLGIDAWIGALYREGNPIAKLARAETAAAEAWRHDYALFKKTLQA